MAGTSAIKGYGSGNALYDNPSWDTYGKHIGNQPDIARDDVPEILKRLQSSGFTPERVLELMKGPPKGKLEAHSKESKLYEDIIDEYSSQWRGLGNFFTGWWD